MCLECFFGPVANGAGVWMAAARAVPGTGVPSAIATHPVNLHALLSTSLITKVRYGTALLQHTLTHNHDENSEHHDFGNGDEPHEAVDGDGQEDARR